MTQHNSEDDVIDRIDALVNESLSKSWDDISGYDNDINQPKCRCGGDWHGLPTRRCPGTDTEGPIRPTGGWQVTVGGGDSDGYTIDALQDARQGFARRSAQDAFLEAITGWPNPMLHTTPGGAATSSANRQATKLSAAKNASGPTNTPPRTSSRGC